MAVAAWPGTGYGPTIQIGYEAEEGCEFEWDCAKWGGTVPIPPAGPTYALHLDATDAATFTYQSGININTWADKSPAARSFVSLWKDADTQRITGAINGLAAVRVAGLGQIGCLDVDPQAFVDPTTRTDTMMFAVITLANASRANLYAHGSGAPPFYDVDLRTTAFFDVANQTTARLTGGLTFSLATPYLYAAYRSGATMCLYRNGTLLLSRTDASGSMASQATADIILAVSNQFRGDIGEVRMVAAYDATQFTTVQAELAAKWGITLAAADPFVEVPDPGRWGPWWDWRNVECDVRAGSNIVRGTASPSQRASSATASLSITPRDNTLSPWYVDPVTGERLNRGNLPIRIGVTDLVTDEEWWLFTGWIDYITEVDSPDELSLTVVASDGLKHMALLNQSEKPPAGAGEAAGSRINRILDNAGWDAGRDLRPGTIALQATTLAQPALEEIFLTADTEAGLVWVDKLGALRFVDREWIADQRSRTDWHLGDRTTDPAAICLSSIVTTADDMDIQNVIGISRVGGTAQWLEDAASIAKYGRQSWSRFDLPYANDADTAAILQVQLADRTARDYHAQAVVLSPLTEPAAWACVLDVELYDTVYLTRTRGEDSRAELGGVIGVDHTFGPAEFVTVLSLGPRIRQTLSRWDVDQWDSARWSAT
jgi:hypothetical protein